jgi:predicted phage terminase large subunit-like protein
MPSGLSDSDYIYIMPDLFWKHGVLTTDLCDEAFRLIRKYNFLVWFAGKDHISGSLKPFIMKRMAEEKRYVFLQEVSHQNRRKRERAQSIRARMQQGRVLWPSYAPWWPEAKTQILKFDKGANDDVVDGLACLGQGLDILVPAAMSGPPPILPPTTFSVKWLKESTRWERRGKEALVLADN